MINQVKIPSVLLIDLLAMKRRIWHHILIWQLDYRRIHGSNTCRSLSTGNSHRMNINAAVTEESRSEGLVLCISTKSNHIRFGRPILHNERCRLSQIVQCIWQWRAIQRWKRESMPTWYYLRSKDKWYGNSTVERGNSIREQQSHFDSHERCHRNHTAGVYWVWLST